MRPSPSPSPGPSSSSSPSPSSPRTCRQLQQSGTARSEALLPVTAEEKALDDDKPHEKREDDADADADADADCGPVGQADEATGEPQAPPEIASLIYVSPPANGCAGTGAVQVENRPPNLSPGADFIEGPLSSATRCQAQAQDSADFREVPRPLGTSDAECHFSVASCPSPSPSSSHAPQRNSSPGNSKPQVTQPSLGRRARSGDAAAAVASTSRCSLAPSSPASPAPGSGPPRPGSAPPHPPPPPHPRPVYAHVRVLPRLEDDPPSIASDSETGTGSGTETDPETGPEFQPRTSRRPQPQPQPLPRVQVQPRAQAQERLSSSRRLPPLRTTLADSRRRPLAEGEQPERQPAQPAQPAQPRPDRHPPQPRGCDTNAANGFVHSASACGSPQRSGPGTGTGSGTRSGSGSGGRSGTTASPSRRRSRTRRSRTGSRFGVNVETPPVPEGKAAWQERERERERELGDRRLSATASACEAGINHRLKSSEARRRWMRRNRIHDTAFGGSSSDEDDVPFPFGHESAAANALLYVGLGTVAVGMVIAFVGTGEKGFKTLELRLIGPTLIVGGVLCCLLRIMLCVCPSRCLLKRFRQRTRHKKQQLALEAAGRIAMGPCRSMAGMSGGPGGPGMPPRRMLSRSSRPPSRTSQSLVRSPSDPLKDPPVSSGARSKKRVSIASGSGYTSIHRAVPSSQSSQMLAATSLFLQNEQQEQASQPKPRFNVPSINLPALVRGRSEDLGDGCGYPRRLSQSSKRLGSTGDLPLLAAIEADHEGSFNSAFSPDDAMAAGPSSASQHHSSMSHSGPQPRAIIVTSPTPSSSPRPSSRSQSSTSPAPGPAPPGPSGLPAPAPTPSSASRPQPAKEIILSPGGLQ